MSQKKIQKMSYSELSEMVRDTDYNEVAKLADHSANELHKELKTLFDVKRLLRDAFSAGYYQSQIDLLKKAKGDDETTSTE